MVASFFPHLSSYCKPGIGYWTLVVGRVRIIIFVFELGFGSDAVRISVRITVLNDSGRCSRFMCIFLKFETL